MRIISKQNASITLWLGTRAALVFAGVWLALHVLNKISGV